MKTHCKQIEKLQCADFLMIAVVVVQDIHQNMFSEVVWPILPQNSLCTLGLGHTFSEYFALN